MFLRKVDITREEFDDFQKPVVYTVTRGGVPIYIGYSRNGYRRLFTRDAQAPNRHKAFVACDSISVRFYSTEEEASSAESDMIHRYHPAYNVACLRCKTRGVAGIRNQYDKAFWDKRYAILKTYRNSIK